MPKPKQIYLSALNYAALNTQSQAGREVGCKEVYQDIEEFEKRCQQTLKTDRPVLAVNSGTAAIHLGLLLAGITAGDHVICQSMTFVASVNPVLYIGAIPVFVDSERQTWNMDPERLEEAFLDLVRNDKRPKAIILTSIYGMPYDYGRIFAFAKANNLTIIDDSAEALGSSYKDLSNGTLGDFGIISFNNNKIISTTGGGLLICPDAASYERGKFLATQAKENEPFYQHKEIGFNYRMGHLNAMMGLSQIPLLSERITMRKQMHNFYQDSFQPISGISVHTAPDDDFKSNYWLSAILVDPSEAGGVTKEDLRLALEAEDIESRPIWKPMHLQPLYSTYAYYGGTVCEELFEKGLCLPSGSNVTAIDRKRIELAIKNVLKY
ncbi:DegT/DnrJ/EryC1/StrS family aminotransferase [Nonlabens marinus]|uniref:4-keto-6-deoxy-N-Acetyl-D-hexosaminyl-(Lipid carrier) aminotransferase n=1 Tax=Nonlabens marinus S1-08 TaxID=1454201 RepID=W8W0Q3_9FLAO|nr:aminotransferase class I/II-fold pyridoxal phosphate-dependent enzyme [Nonlabens marinus]BAO56726.1 4-keto-6-deoxy-N-Acetyl-D-hexosaminyl-(Lipid carrier) aminotransferase [Nonlabens marinus S1-08]